MERDTEKHRRPSRGWLRSGPAPSFGFGFVLGVVFGVFMIGNQAGVVNHVWGYILAAFGFGVAVGLIVCLLMRRRQGSV